MKLTPEYILEQFNNSGKRHLIITGWRRKGKTTLFNKITALISKDGKTLPGLTSYMVPQINVLLRNNLTGQEGIVGIHCPEKAEIGKNMIAYSDGFYSVGIPALKDIMQNGGEWFSMDEIGFLESNELAFQKMLLKAMEEKHLIAVVRKTEKGKVPFIDCLLSREDVYILDLDQYDTTEYWD